MLLHRGPPFRRTVLKIYKIIVLACDVFFKIENVKIDLKTLNPKHETRNGSTLLTILLILACRRINSKY